MPLTFATLLPLLLRYAPEAFDVIGHVVANIAAGRANQAPVQADWDEITRLAANTSESIYARLGVKPPPAAA